MAEASHDESEILTAYALRCRTPASYEDAGRLVSRLIDAGAFPATLVEQLDCLFGLQRHLFKWGGEALPDNCPEWKAIRSLFLVTAPIDLPRVLQSAERYAEWERAFRPNRAKHLALVAEKHFNTRYITVGLSHESPTTAQLLSLYDLEGYLFGTVGHRFRSFGTLTAFDLFAIVIWKANRAKSIIARRLLKQFPGKGLDEIARSLGHALRAAECAGDGDGQARLRVMFDHGFRLPMASAILTVLYPDVFTVYDVRACESLQIDEQCVNDASSDSFATVWNAYDRFRNAVRVSHSDARSLRDKDRALWAESFHKQLKKSVESNFDKAD